MRGEARLLCEVWRDLWMTEEVAEGGLKVLKGSQGSPAPWSSAGWVKPIITTSWVTSSSSSPSQGSWHKASWRDSVFPQLLLCWLLNLAAALAIPQCPKLLKEASVQWGEKINKSKASLGNEPISRGGGWKMKPFAFLALHGRFSCRVSFAFASPWSCCCWPWSSCHTSINWMRAN